MKATCDERKAEIGIVWQGKEGPTTLTAPAPCASPVLVYRQCGKGCKVELAYCDQHGGDTRAQREMALHHEQQHGEAK